MTNIRQKDVQTPHFTVPFKFGGGNGCAFVNEQDTSDDYVDCIKAILAFPIGSREDLPGFGRPDIVFRELHRDTASKLVGSIIQWEPRVDIDGDLKDVFDELIQQIVINVRGGEPK